MAGLTVYEKHCMICDNVEPPRMPPAIQVYDVQRKYVICKECKRAVLYARELLKEKEKRGQFSLPEY